MSKYKSKFAGSVIDATLTAVIDGQVGIQGVKVNNVETVPDQNKKVNLTIPNVLQTTGSSTTDVMSQNVLTNILGNKVDSIQGKGLSTNDYTTEEKTKLSGIEAQANKTIVVQTTGSSTTDVMSQDVVTTELNSKATTASYTVTLAALAWVDQGNSPYTQTVNVQGILSTDYPFVDVVLSSTASTAIEQLDAFSCISKIETNNGSITATCLSYKPSIDLPIKLKVVR